jgi:hypothetical protein
LSAHRIFEVNSLDDAGVRQGLATDHVVLYISGSDAARAEPSMGAAAVATRGKSGDTSFLDGIAYPGWVVELTGQGVHDNRTANNTGHVLPGITNINSGAALAHIALLSHARYLEACTGLRWFSLLPMWTKAAMEWGMAWGM